MAIEQGEVLWAPTARQVEETRLAQFIDYVAQRHGKRFDDYQTLWQWSVDELETFWSTVLQFFQVQADGDPGVVLADARMPGAKWFPGLQLNYAEHVFRNADASRPALLARSEDCEPRFVSWQELRDTTGALAATLRESGVGPGDRVVSYMPNRPETVMAFLACASIGAIWSSCSPEMGVSVVVDRFRQIEPKVMFAVDSYRYNGKVHERGTTVSELLEQLPSVERVIHVAGPACIGQPAWRGCTSWQQATARSAPLAFTRLPFDHPLWIVYSSGTTGIPKAMVHGHGGIVLTHLKTMQLQHDVRAGDRFMFLGSTGWIVWNLMVGGLLSGATVVLYDGNPSYPDTRSLWRFIDEHAVTHFGCGAAFLVQCKKDGLQPGRQGRFDALRAINSTGSPLPLDAYEWVYNEVKKDLWLASISGGTDIASGFVACAPCLPVTAGEIQCRELGVAAYAFDDGGRPVIDEVGELVITRPMPSMPLYFWSDPGNARYIENYFETFPGCWRHGDWIRFSPQGTAVIYGRSDTTINRYGIRMGTAEIYRVVEELPEIRDSMVVDLEYLGRPSYMPLFVVLAQGMELDEALAARIKEQIRSKASARHVPNEVHQVPQIPRTLSGKKMELPVRKLLLGASVDKVASPDAMANPESMAWYVDFAKRLNPAPIES
ncbi:acetoacetate--CoA ligase [Pusillimonas caeni]|uniref:acetoacetate--CoA ligase n=1 Tax=Pusillimonas caeni TaxID=1348472 RepID=UPI000E59BA71|nr:acetoacetate--CoA ligase [Pusillimonas caeni]TFL10009.1 acetoacetate--CoA ligase [Pusillimonas caeni]